MYPIIKRVFDIFAGLVGIIILIPVTIILKIAYLCTGDFHPIIYTQKRIGKGGRIFEIYKYRSMVWGAEAKLKEMMKKDKKIRDEYTKYKKLANDPRVTKIGGFLRRHSLDELPQFINLLTGDMALVGNRPYLLTEKPEMGKYYKEIIKTKPGITGLWQISSHNKMVFEERLKLEAAYVECFEYDWGVLVNTARIAVFGGEWVGCDMCSSSGVKVSRLSTAALRLSLTSW